MWFRVEVHKDGSVKSCTQVAESFDEGRHVFYIEADSKELALDKVGRFLETRRRQSEKAKAKYRANVEAWKAAGLCVRCGKRPATKAKKGLTGRPRGATMCDECKNPLKNRNNPYLRRHYADSPDAQYRKAHLQGRLASVRAKLRVIIRIEEAYTLNPSGFRAWLAKERADIEAELCLRLSDYEAARQPKPEAAE